MTDYPTMTDSNELVEALAKAQAEMTNPAFDAENPHFRNRFASLAAVRNAVVPVLAKYGIAVAQNLTTTATGVACSTMLLKGRDRLVFGPLEIPATKSDAQGFGSAATYARRYSLQSVCCVVGDADDDANAASRKLDPMGKADLTVSTAHGDYAAAFRRALAAGDDLGVIQTLDDCNSMGEEFFRAVWTLLDSKERSAIKATKARIKSA